MGRVFRHCRLAAERYVSFNNHMELLIVNRKKTWFDKLLWGLFVIMSAITIVSFIENFALKQFFFVVTGAFIMITTILYEIYHINHKPFVELGRIVISKEDLIIHENSIDIRIRFEDLEYLKFEINETSLDKYFRGLFNKKKDGDGNFIEIKQSNGNYFKFNTYIENVEQIKEIDDFVKNSNRIELKLVRQGKIVKSILDLHYKDYPKHYFNTSGKRYYKN